MKKWPTHSLCPNANSAELTSISTVPLAPLALWPLGFLYGAAVVPAPGGGGAVEMAFRAALGGAIPAQLFAASLIWWRFYTFYIYILLGALAAGSTVLRAVLGGPLPYDANAPA